MSIFRNADNFGGAQPECGGVMWPAVMHACPSCLARAHAAYVGDFFRKARYAR